MAQASRVGEAPSANTHCGPTANVAAHDQQQRGRAPQREPCRNRAHGGADANHWAPSIGVTPHLVATLRGPISSPGREPDGDAMPAQLSAGVPPVIVPPGERLRGRRVMEGTGRLLIYSHDSFGLGHLRRCQTIAHHLVDAFPDLTALILSGSPIIGSFDFKSGLTSCACPA